MNELSKKHILILLAVIAIIAIVIIIVSIFDAMNGDNKASGLNPYTNEKYLTEKELQEKVENMDIYENLDIVVNNLYDFVKVYRGDLATKDYTEYIKNLNKNFQDLYVETVDISNTNNYFTENKEKLKIKYGIEDVATFDELLNYISIYEKNVLTYKDVTLEKNSVEDEGEYVKTKVNITYSNDITKTIFVKVLKDTSLSKPQFVISF